MNSCGNETEVSTEAIGDGGDGIEAIVFRQGTDEVNCDAVARGWGNGERV